MFKEAEKNYNVLLQIQLQDMKKMTEENMKEQYKSKLEKLQNEVIEFKKS